jgi:hypothetical protein
MLISSKAFGKLLVEPKTLGWEHSRNFFENVFKNLGCSMNVTWDFGTTDIVVTYRLSCTNDMGMTSINLVL